MGRNDRTKLPRVCVIGAGSSGIAAAKALHEAGIPFDCYEKGSRVGGNWVFRNDNGVSACYETLHINTSKTRMAFSDFPMGEDLPSYPSHRHIAEYFDAYVDHFGFRDRIVFRTSVEHAALEDGLWRVRLSNGRTETYDALIVANGHHWDPRWPEPAYPGRFDGVQMHSHAYEERSIFEGERVLVVGLGNSAADIAVDASLVAEKTYLSARRGVYVFSKYLFGRPSDELFVAPYFPRPLLQAFSRLFQNIRNGPMENYGLPKPDHDVLESHPTVSEELLPRLAHGKIEPVPGIARFEGKKVHFTDGSVREVDRIVWCTGYKVSFPFFDPGFFQAVDNETPPLFRRVFSVDHPNLMFVGLVQPLGAIMPIAEAQSRWIVEYLAGGYHLPSRDAMLRSVEREREYVDASFVKAPRHTLEIPFDEYLIEAKVELGLGRLRARWHGNELPIPPRATPQEPPRERVADLAEAS